MDAFETFEHAGCVIELYPDDMDSSPADWDNLGTLVWFDRRNEMQGTESSDNDADEAYDRGGCALLVRYLRMTRGEIVVPFQFQDYGSNGARLLALDDDDDARAHGYIYADAASIEMTGVEPENVREGLVQDLRTWDDYFQGRVIGYVVKSGDVVLDSCWGFYPDDEDGEDGYAEVRAEARAMAEHEAEERARVANQDIATA